jgi:hypothetical protein
MTSVLSNATRKVLNTIKFCLSQSKLNEELFSVRGEYWSFDNANWKELPTRWKATLNSITSMSLDNTTEKNVQSYLISDFEPFFALRHLHKAIKETNPRYKWIDATIAAELAIKEFLVRSRPELETLLLEMPSPPLDKLYGSVLESFTKQKSPKLTALREGARIRNKLVHRPNETKITHEQANSYVHDVEAAIYHLLSLRYPEDRVIRKLFEHSLH